MLVAVWLAATSCSANAQDGSAAGGGAHGAGATGGGFDGGGKGGLGSGGATGGAPGESGTGGLSGVSCPSSQSADEAGTGQFCLFDACDAGIWLGSGCTSVDAIHGLSDCGIDIPPPPDGGSFNPNELNVVSFYNGCHVIGKVASSADCGPNGGWYYDNDANPTRVLVCPASCSIMIKSRFEFGCDTIQMPH